MKNDEKEKSVDTTTIMLDLLKEVLERLEGLNGNYKKTSKPPRNGGSITALVVVTLLLGVLLGAMIALMLNGCVETGVLMSLGTLYGCRSAQIKLIHESFYSVIVDKNDTMQPIDKSAARKLLTDLGYIFLSQETEKNGTIIETWELPVNRQTPC